MIRYIATAAILASAGAAHAQDSRFQPMQLGDAQYACEQLITEARTMEEQIGGQPSGAVLGEAAMGLGTDLAIRAGGYQAARAIGMFGGVLSGAMERQKQAEEDERARAAEAAAAARRPKGWWERHGVKIAPKIKWGGRRRRKSRRRKSRRLRRRKSRRRRRRRGGRTKRRRRRITRRKGMRR